MTFVTLFFTQSAYNRGISETRPTAPAIGAKPVSREIITMSAKTTTTTALPAFLTAEFAPNITDETARRAAQESAIADFIAILPALDKDTVTAFVRVMEFGKGTFTFNDANIKKALHAIAPALPREKSALDIAKAELRAALKSRNYKAVSEISARIQVLTGK